MNRELLGKLADFGLSFAIIMALIVLACLVTPRIAKFIEKKNPRIAERNRKAEEEYTSPEKYEVKDPYGKQETPEGFDPNYKIYNEDIYGVDFKHGKKQKNG